MDNFAKVFGTGENQVLLTLLNSENGDGLEMTLYAYPKVKLLSVCSSILTSKSDKKSIKSFRATFENIDEKQAFEMAEKFRKPLQEQFKN